MTNSLKDAAEIAARLHRLSGLTDNQIASLSLTLDPVQVDQVSDSVLALLANGTLPTLPLNPAGGLPLGLPGAVQASRFVGATSSGPPTTGTFAVGDFVIVQSGGISICTTAGSPGTWQAPGDGTFAALTLAGQERVATLNDSRLRTFRAALAGARRGTQKCVIAVVGDSKSEGQNSDSGATYQDTWPRYLQSMLRNRFQPPGIAGGDSYVPAWYGRSAPAAQEFNYGGTVSTDYSTGWFNGLGMRAVKLLTTSGTATITRVCSSFDLHYNNQVSGTKITVQVDGGSVTTITTDSNGGNRRWNSGALTPGPHTVVVGYGSGSAAAVLVEGVRFFNGDETAGVEVVDASRYGQTASSFVANQSSWVNALNLIAPDLVIVRLGANDMAQFSAATFQTKLTALLSSDADSLNTRLTKKPSYLILPPEQLQSSTSTIDSFSAYGAAVYAQISDATAPAVLDLSLRMPQDSSSGPLGLIGSDGLHETSKGYQFVANAVATLLTGTAGGTHEPATNRNNDLILNGEETMPRELVATAVSPASGQLRLTYFTARKTETVNNVRVITSTTAAAATPTLCRVGIYREAANGDLTLVASTTNDTTLFSGAGIGYTKALASALSKVRGVRYAVGVLVVSGATMPNFAGQVLLAAIGNDAALPPRLSGQLASQTDLPSTITSGSLGTSGQMYYATVAP